MWQSNPRYRLHKRRIFENRKIGKIRRSIIPRLVMSNRLRILLYGLECYTLIKADIKSLYFVVRRCFLVNNVNSGQQHQ